MSDFHEHPQHDHAANSSRRGVHVRMRGRDAAEDHRAATPLELLVDLVFIVAVASLVLQLAHGIAEGHGLESIPPFLMVFCSIWWAWMNFTWLASAYDTDDALYRLLTVVQMAGVLVLAAGVPAAFESVDFRAVTVGYLIMRIGLVGQWVRAAVEHAERRATTRRYALGVTIVQVGWLLRLLLPDEWAIPSFLVLIAFELAVPIWSERRGWTPWHPRHIAERYGLFVIILLGEGVLAATNGVQRALSSGLTPALVVVAIAGLVIIVAMWWTYFLEPAAEGLAEHRRWGFFWGYGHYFLFVALAALGAGLEVAVEAVSHHLDVPDVAVGYTIALPVAVVLILMWALHLPFAREAEIPPGVVLPAAALVLLAPLATGVVGLAGVVVVVALLVSTVVAVTTALRRPDVVDAASRSQLR
ncbi:MAG TPA: low temperature requirement protein A [Pseudolysinimonas sp.]|nr:low temperature requirement protein A [Pseudolysinimonas sp.]